MSDKRPPPPPVLPKPKSRTSIQRPQEAETIQESRRPLRIAIPAIFQNNPPVATSSHPTPVQPNSVITEPRTEDAGSNHSSLTSPRQAQLPIPPVAPKPKPQPNFSRGSSLTSPPQTQSPTNTVAANAKPRSDFKHTSSSATLYSQPFNYLCPSSHSSAPLLIPDETRPTSQLDVVPEARSGPPPASEPLPTPSPEPPVDINQETNTEVNYLSGEQILLSNSQKEDTDKSGSFLGIGTLKKQWSKLKKQRISKFFQRKTPSTSSPLHPQYVAEASRLRTFKRWHGNPLPKDLAKAGFFHIGPDDNVKCFFCDIQMCDWKATDDPWAQHVLYRPQCPFVTQSKGEFSQATNSESEYDSEHIYSTIDSDGEGQELSNIPVENVLETPPSVEIGRMLRVISSRHRLIGLSNWESPITSSNGNILRTPAGEETDGDHIYANLPSGTVAGDAPRLPAHENIPGTPSRDEIPRSIPSDLLPSGDCNNEMATGYHSDSIDYSAYSEGHFSSHDDASIHNLNMDLNRLRDADNLQIEVPRAHDNEDSARSYDDEETNPYISSLDDTFAFLEQSSEVTGPSARGVDDSEVMSSMNSVVVKLVLDLDFPVFLVEMAVRQKLQADGEVFSCPEDLIEAILNLADKDGQASTVETTELTEGAGPIQADNATSRDISGSALHTDPRKLEEEIHRLQEEKKCKVCLDGEICITFIPCGHFSCCAGCAAQLKTCPICRKGITSSVRTYMS